MRRVLLSTLLATIVACAEAGSGPEAREVDPVTAETVPSTHAGFSVPSQPATTASSNDFPSELPFNPVEGESLVAVASDPVQVFSGPEQPAPFQVLEEFTILGSPRVFLVENGPEDGWVKLSLPVRPNGSTGWARSSDFRFEVVSHLVIIDLSDFRLVFLDSTNVLFDTPVATGSADNPTPTGRFFVTDVVELADHGGPWGPFAIGLSAHSDTITEFNGGDGIVGIHGTNRPSKIGQPVSLGCIRVPNDVITDLAALIELGTPVVIRG